MSLLREARNSLSQEVFDALADPTRRTILELLASNGQMSATDIYDNFSMTNPAVSQHLKILREAELVEIEKDAQKHIYSFNPKRMLDLEEWITRTTELWSKRFDRLDGVLEAEKRKMQRKRR